MNKLIKPYSYTVDLLITIFVLLAYLLMQPIGSILHEGWTENIYRIGLLEHFWEYISYTPLKPPLFSILHVSALQFAHLIGITESAAIGALVITLNVAVAPLIYRTSINFKANRISSAVMSILASLSLLPLIAKPLNYDLPAYFFMSLFIFSVSQVFKFQGTKGFILLSLASGLLIAQSTVQIVTVPLIVLIIAVTLATRENIRALIKKFLMISVFPALVVGAILLKNFLAIGLIGNSSLGGHTLMLVLMGMNQWNVPVIREAVVKSGAPDWYLWCFDNPAQWEAGPYPAFMSAMGHCFDEGMDMDRLKAQMERLKAPEMVKVVERDTVRLQQKPYLLAGISPDMSTEWFAKYSMVSAKVAVYVFRQNPTRWLNQSKYIHGNHFSRSKYDYILSDLLERQKESFRENLDFVKGITEVSKYVRFWTYRLIPYLWLFLAMMIAAKVLTRESQLKRWFPQKSKIVITTSLIFVTVGLAYVSKPYFEWFYYGFERKYYWKPVYGILLSFIILTLFVQYDPMTKFRKPILKFFDFFWDLEGAVILILIAQVSVLGFLYSSVVGTENHRFFFQLTPYVFVLSAVLTSIVMHSLICVFGSIRGINSSTFPTV